MQHQAYYADKDSDDIADHGYIRASEREITKCIHCGRFFASMTWSDFRVCDRPACLKKGPHPKSHIPLREGI